MRRLPVWQYADVAQLVERIHGKDEVSGSIPDIGSEIRKKRGIPLFVLLKRFI
jgi:hypothetical protein